VSPSSTKALYNPLATVPWSNSATPVGLVRYVPRQRQLGEPADPSPLSGRLDRSWSVVLAGPGDGGRSGMSGEDRHAGDDRASSSGAAHAGDFDALTGARQQVGVVERGSGLLIATGSAEIGPVDPVRGPVRLPGRSPVAERGGPAEVETVVRCWSCGERLAPAAAADQRSVGQRDRAGERRLGHLSMLPAQFDRRVILIFYQGATK
jgi:hypothetical protein